MKHTTNHSMLRSRNDELDNRLPPSLHIFSYSLLVGDAVIYNRILMFERPLEEDEFASRFDFYPPYR